MTIKVRRADFGVQVQTWDLLKNHKCQSVHCNIWFQIPHSMGQNHNWYLSHTHTHTHTHTHLTVLLLQQP